MKQVLTTALVVFTLMSCGNATDGDAKTDTTNFPADTGGTMAPADTANHINTSTGTYPGDSMTNTKSDVRSSSPSSPGSRSTTPGSTTGGSTNQQ